MKEIIISKNYENMRLDRYIGKVTTLSKVSSQKLIRKKNIKVNGKKAEANYHLLENDVVRLYLDDKYFIKEEVLPKKHHKDFNIIYENENIIIINKKANLLSQGDKSGEASVVDMLRDYLGSRECGIITRLDRNTSGLVICGKNRRSLMILNKLSKENKINKEYKALVHGAFNQEGEITHFGKKDEEQGKLLLFDLGREGLFNVESSFEILKKYKDFTLLKVALITGRFHQIRAQLNHMGFSILGDRKYNDFSKKSSLTSNRQFLQCYKINISLDEVSKEIIKNDLTITIPLDDDLKLLTDKLTLH